MATTADIARKSRVCSYVAVKYFTKATTITTGPLILHMPTPIGIPICGSQHMNCKHVESIVNFSASFEVEEAFKVPEEPGIRVYYTMKRNFISSITVHFHGFSICLIVPN